MGRYMGDWLLNHIGKIDKALGAFLQEKGKK
jgi:hemerythrin